MRKGLLLGWGLLWAACAAGGAQVEAPPPAKVYILPIRDQVGAPLVYLVRRGVKEAMENHAETLILDMHTPGGRVDSTMELLEILDRFPGRTATYVNKHAFSAGAFIAFGTQQIYMAPQSVIGAAAPILLSPVPGSTPDSMPDTLEVKTTSGIKAMMRTYAEKNGYNIEVVEAMIDKTKEVVIEGEVLNPKGSILTLTDQQAARKVGNPPKPLLSSGTFESMEDLLAHLGYTPEESRRLVPTGAERLASWINAISPILLMIGLIGVYLEFKTPGFGIFGVVAILAFGFYFFGSYIAGFSGWEWMLIFLAGLALLLLEMFVFPGTILPGLIGSVLMIVSLFMALVDLYPTLPNVPGPPVLSWQAFKRPVQVFALAALGGGILLLLLSRWFPRTPMYNALVSTSASGVHTSEDLLTRHEDRIGEEGVAISPLRPGGKAQFGEEVLDVITQGEMIPKGQRVRIIGHRSGEALVEAAG